MKEGITKLACLCVLIPSIGWSLETRPWLKTPFECYLTTAYTYSYFNAVNSARPPLSDPWNNHLLAVDFSFAPSDHWDVELEVEWADTRYQAFGYRSAVLQGRWQWWNDIAGDPVSGTLGINIREVSRQSLGDVSCPYHATVNLELTSAIGKEWSNGVDWLWRSWGMLGLGIGNWGAPWFRWTCVLDRHFAYHHRVYGFLEGYFGLGAKDHVDPDQMKGWGHYHHQSIDFGAAYEYHFDRYGHLSLSYAYRLYAHVFPEKVQFLMISYQLPFSLF